MDPILHLRDSTSHYAVSTAAMRCTITTFTASCGLAGTFRYMAILLSILDASPDIQDETAEHPRLVMMIAAMNYCLALRRSDKRR